MSGAESRPTPTESNEVSLSFIVACPQGCCSAHAVLGKVREQMNEGDELIVVESATCSIKGSAEIHQAVGTQDEDVMIVAGTRMASRKVVVVLEDHAVTAGDFARTMRECFSHTELDVLTFEVRNGTSRSVGSRALFLFDYGLSLSTVPKNLRERVSASFAIRKLGLDTWLDTEESHERPAALRYAKIHELSEHESISVTKRPAIIHHQAVSVVGAVLAVCLNAIRQGALDKQVIDKSAARELSRSRYFNRTSQIRELSHSTGVIGAALTGLGIAGWFGWWLGRSIGNVNIGALMTRVHRPPDVN